ncbi:MAG: 50S ribosomal protein L25 [Candidatus Yanofskybacteria bacterium]|nr:50S ribosomal protein L25 [Candidatus Yanofskybacteria bacterium]
MMAKTLGKIELNAARRTSIGGGLNKLRTDGYIPAVLYGKDQESIPLQVPAKDFGKVLKEAGESTLIYVNVGGQSYPTIIHDVSKDTLTDGILHADFYKVRLDEKIKTNVPVVFVGESPAVKDLGGVFVRNVNELEVEALPQNLPHELTIDISILKNFGDKITIKDLKQGLGTLAELTTEDADAIIAAVQEPMSEEELKASLETPTTGVEDVEVIKKEKPEEVAEEAETKEEKAAE